MIQESHVGIGILGKEGAHAAMSSDFVLKRFNHLRRLICVHGRNNYWRTTQVVMFSFYKNLAFPLPLFWFTFYSMANGTTSYDSLLIVRSHLTRTHKRKRSWRAPFFVASCSFLFVVSLACALLSRPLSTRSSRRFLLSSLVCSIATCTRRR